MLRTPYIKMRASMSMSMRLIYKYGFSPKDSWACRDSDMRDIRYIAIFFGHIAIQTCMGNTEIDGRMDRYRRMYEK